jgi:hypothetical protein
MMVGRETNLSILMAKGEFNYGICPEFVKKTAKFIHDDAMTQENAL